jgi:hypothetical protein
MDFVGFSRHTKRHVIPGRHWWIEMSKPNNRLLGVTEKMDAYSKQDFPFLIWTY